LNLVSRWWYHAVFDRRFEDAVEEPETAKRLPNGLMYELQRFLRHGAISTSGNYHNVGKGNSGYAGRFRRRLPLPEGAQKVSSRSKCGFSAQQMRGIEHENVLRLIPRPKA